MQYLKRKEHQLNNVIPFIPEADFYFARGVQAFQKRKFDIALKWLQKAIDAAPHDPLYKCQKSVIYTEIGLFDQANTLLINVLNTSGEQYVDCFYFLANNYAHLGLLSDAKKYALLYLEKVPNGDYSEEAKELLELIEIDEEDDWMFDDEDELIVYQETAFYYLECMEWKKAIAILEDMLHRFPDHKTALHDYAQALFFDGNQDEALRLELDNIQKNGDSLASYTNVALFYYEMNQQPEYKTYIRALLNVYPIHEQQKLKIAVVLARTGYYEEAKERFVLLNKEAVSGHLSYYRWYSYAMYHLGQIEKANKLWQKACEKHPIMAKEVQPWKQ